MLYVCLFLLIKKLEQFRTTIHCRCADMAAAPLPMAAGDGKRDTRGGTTPLKWQRISASSRGAPELGYPASSGPWVPPPSLFDSGTFGALRLKVPASSRGAYRDEAPGSGRKFSELGDSVFVRIQKQREFLELCSHRITLICSVCT